MTRALLCSNLSNSFPLIPLLAIALVILLHSLIIGKRVQIVVHEMRSHVITPLLMSLASIVTAYMSNNFSGTIPQTFEYASLLLELDISNNGLQGVLPTSLANCTNLEILNVGHNFIEDAFPFWLENLPQLKIIVL
ncbi:hypothetical protein ACSBR1_020990 [Camellia fascicularis]